MRNRRMALVCMILILAAAFLLFVSLRNNVYPNPEYNGERICGEDQFTLIFTAMNGEQTHTMSLQAGDTLHCAWRIDQGNVDIMISMDETKIYQGNKVDAAEFDVVILADGEYAVSVKGTHAAGRIDISRQQ